MASCVAMVRSADDLQPLASSLELALKGCMAQLRSLRASSTVNKQSSTYASEERALKLSLASIVAQLQSVREAGQAHRTALLLAVLPGVLQMLSTTAVLRLEQVSAAARASVTTGGEKRLLFLPHLDSVPFDPVKCQRFLVERIALGSVRWLALPANATSVLLSERVASLNAVESLLLPFGCEDFSNLPRLASLRRLAIDARHIVDTGSVALLSASLLGLLRPLQLLRICALKSSLAVHLVDSIMCGGLVHRLVFHQCVLPDAAVACVCRTLLQGGSSGVPLSAVRFEECGLSDFAEQHLLATLEQCDGRCLVTIDGGMARTHAEEALSEPADLKGHEVECLKQSRHSDMSPKESKRRAGDVSELDQQPPPKGPDEEVMPIQQMLAMALLRLQEERSRPDEVQSIFRQHEAMTSHTSLLNEPAVASSSCDASSPVPIFGNLSSCLSIDAPDDRSAEDESHVRHSRFGFALDDSP